MKALAVNLKSVLLLFGAVQGAFLSLVLSRIRSGNRNANRFLACLLILFSLSLVEGFLSTTYYALRFPFLLGLTWPMFFMYGPLIYFYVKSLTGLDRQMERWKIYIHFIPALLFYLYLTPFFLADPDIKARAWLVDNSDLKNYTPLVDPILFVGIMQITGYLFLALRLLKSHTRNIEQTFSSLENINLSWMRTLLIVFFGLLCLYTFSAVVSQFYGLYMQAEYATNLAIAAAIYIMGYKGIRQPEIFSGSAALPVPVPGDSNERRKGMPVAFPGKRETDAERQEAGKYRKSALTNEQAEKIVVQLTGLMEQKKPYLEMELTLPMLSNMLNVTPNILSQVINEKLGRSFFDFVNAYRVEEAKKSLLSSESNRFSILGIAMDAGFNSKSSFYNAFKKHTGMTPSQFKKWHTSRDYPQVRQMP